MPLSVPEVASFHHASLDAFSTGARRCSKKARKLSISGAETKTPPARRLSTRRSYYGERRLGCRSLASMPPSRVVPAASFRVPFTPVAPGVILPLPATSPPIRPSPLPCNLSWCSLSLCAPYDASLNRRAVAGKVIAARGPSDSVFTYVQGYVGGVERWLVVQRHERPLEARRSSATSSGKASMRVGSFPAGSSVLYVADGLPDCSPGWTYEASLIVSAGETRRTNNLPPVSGGRARRRDPGGCPGRLRRAAELCQRS